MQDLGLTKRQIRNEETKEKLRNAMEEIMNKYDYNTVTIRNICKVSGVSYGSFYNLFESKEAFLRDYLTFDFVQHMNQYYKSNEAFEGLSWLEKSIDIFISCARYNVEKGLKFISGFYSPDNHTLFPIAEKGEKEYSFTPLLRMACEYLERARASGELEEKVDINQTANMYCYLFNGITFNWCISNGRIDVAGILRGKC